MDVTAGIRNSTPPVLGLVAAVGSAAALLATYWDDSWHTDKGRDEFAIPPHLLLYGGVLLASLTVAAWGVLAWRRAGWGWSGIRAVLADPALLLAGLGGTTTLLAGPIDAAWHEAFGRDAVLWSPPHLMAVVGTLALSVGLLAGLARSRGRGAQAARLLAAAGVIGTLQVAVLEYDSDVPQFSTVWFLPVAALGVCLAVVVLDDLLPGRWDATAAAAIYVLLRIVAIGFLALLDFSLTAVPPAVVLFALAAVLPRDRAVLRLLAVGAAAPLVWWLAVRLQNEVATQVPPRQLPAAVALSLVAALAVALAHGDVRVRPSGRASAAATTVVLVLATLAALTAGAPQAMAHDPGQGEPRREGRLELTRTGDRAQITMTLPGSCPTLTPVRTVARRAGALRQGPLSIGDAAGVCRLDGSVDRLTEGRWFVYVEADDDQGARLEAWLPAESDGTHAETRALYQPPTTPGVGMRNAAGAVLLMLALGLLVACLRLARRTAAGIVRSPAHASATGRRGVALRG